MTGFVMIGLLDFTGPLQTFSREHFGLSGFPPIRSGGGVVFAMTLALYPYAYLLARNAFMTQGRCVLEAAQSLGLSRRQGFFRVALPMARPWIVGGVSLAITNDSFRQSDAPDVFLRRIPEFFAWVPGSADGFHLALQIAFGVMDSYRHDGCGWPLWLWFVFRDDGFRRSPYLLTSFCVPGSPGLRTVRMCMYVLFSFNAHSILRPGWLA